MLVRDGILVGERQSEWMAASVGQQYVYRCATESELSRGGGDDVVRGCGEGIVETGDAWRDP